MPSDEAMKAAKKIQERFMQENRVHPRQFPGWEEISTLIDRETRLPALLAVIEAARDCDWDSVCERHLPDCGCGFCRLRAALEKLPPEGGKTQ